MLRFGLTFLIALLTAAVAVPSDARTAQLVAIEGSWTAERVDAGSGDAKEVTLTFSRNGNTLAGTMRTGSDELSLFDIRDAGGTLSFTLVIPGTPYVTVHYQGTRTDTELKLASAEEGNGVFTLNAKRSRPAPQQAAAERPSARTAAVPPPPPLRPSTTAERQATPEPAAPPPAPAVREPVQAEPTPVQVPDVPAADIASASPPETAAPEPSASSSPAEPPPEIASVAPPSSPRVAPVPAGPVVKLPLPALRDLTPNTVLKTPPIGWATRQRLGVMIDDESIRQAADGLEETGLKRAGFTYIEVDDGWQGARDATGALRGHEKFPDMKALGDYIHSKGLTFGLMTSAAPVSCGGFTGSYGHEIEDAKAFAEWGVDVLIYDWCGAEKIYPAQAEMQAAYQKMGEALRASGRAIAYAVSQGGQFNVASWAPKTGANIWRAGKDIEDSWQSMLEGVDAFNGTGATEPGQWSDPGLLQVGNGGMTAEEYRTHLNIWAVLGGPMVLGNDVRIMRKETVDLLSTNREVIGIHQDPAALQGRRVAQTGMTEAWAKQLADGSTVVVFINRGTTSAPAAVSWQQLGIMGPRLVRDLWWHENLGTANNRYSAFLTAHTSLLVRMIPP